METDLIELKKLSTDISILYVEDEAELLESVTRYLKKLFSTVYTANNGKDGYKLYQEKQPDIVITDINMPQMNGLEMSTAIKEDNEEQNIIVISAYSDAEHFTNFIKLGIDGYILKPIDFKQLNSSLYKVVYKINQFKENQHYKENLEQMVEAKTNELRVLEHEKINNYKRTLFALVKMIEDRDTYTGGHSLRVARYARMIAKQMGFDNESCETIHKAGILHDIGKVAIPDNILLKPGALDNVEFTLIKEHVNMGVKILKKVPMFQQLVSFIEAHHERLDGSGYPNGLHGDQIPLEAQILALCDTFDAITTSRIYKGKKTVQEAIKEIEALSDKHFKKEIVDAAKEVLPHITIDEQITQLPQTAIEQERFAYFYKDQATQSYNATYLDLVLLQNSYNKKYQYLYLISTENLKSVYKEYGWKEGDSYLKDIYEYLEQLLLKGTIFRVFNDDFVILSKEQLSFNQEDLQKLPVKGDVSFKLQQFNLEETTIFSLHDLERLQ